MARKSVLTKKRWEEIFAALDAAEIPEDFLKREDSGDCDEKAIRALLK
jgi:hypothetical protein